MFIGKEQFIFQKLDDLGRNGAVLGLSGGLDSAVAAALAVRALGREKVQLLYLPERDSNPLHRGHARQFADHLGLPLHRQNISTLLRAAKTYRILPLGLVPGRRMRTRLVKFARGRLLRHNDERILSDRLSARDEWLTKGNAYGMAKHRLRMALVYQHAELNNLMVIGAANRTEWLTGTFSQWGVDHCADLMPLLHLYRTQVEEIAVLLGIPDYIRLKTSDPDLYPAQINKGEMLGGFNLADQIIFNLENGVPIKELKKAFDTAVVDHLDNLYRSSRFMRQAPYYLEPLN
jgi:NAD+ synthase